MTSVRARRHCCADRRAHCAMGNASKAGNAVVNARAVAGRRGRSAKRCTACVIVRDSSGGAFLGAWPALRGGARGRSVSSARLTKAPAPTRASTRPSAVRRSKASMTVVRETPSSCASVRLAGRRSPTATLPDRINSRSAPCSCELTERDELGSMAMDSSNAPPARLTIRLRPPTDSCRKRYHGSFRMDLSHRNRLTARCAIVSSSA